MRGTSSTRARPFAGSLSGKWVTMTGQKLSFHKMLAFLFVIACIVGVDARGMVVPGMFLRPKSASADSSKAPVVRSVTLKSTLVPPSIVASATTATSILGSPADSKKIDRLARRINEWYERNGYLLSKVVGYTTTAKGDVILTAREPITAQDPVSLEFFSPLSLSQYDQQIESRKDSSWRQKLRAETGLLAEIAPVPFRKVDNETPERLQRRILQARLLGVREATLSAAERKLQRARQELGILPPTRLERHLLRHEVRRVVGVTRPKTVADALGLRPGEPFRLDRSRFQQMQQSSLFETSDTRAMRGNDEQVQLRVQVVEQGAREGKPARTRRIAPSVSLALGSLSGEVALEDVNWRGANQRLTVEARRSNGTELTLRLLDPRLGRPLSTEAVASWQPTRRTSPPSPQQPSRGDKGSAHAQAKRAQASQDESAYAGELETCERCASAKYIVHGGRRATFFSGGVDAQMVPVIGGADELPLALTATLTRRNSLVHARGVDVELLARHSLPVSAQSPRFWKLQSSVKMRMPLSAALDAVAGGRRFADMLRRQPYAKGLREVSADKVKLVGDVGEQKKRQQVGHSAVPAAAIAAYPGTGVDTVAATSPRTPLRDAASALSSSLLTVLRGATYTTRVRAVCASRDGPRYESEYLGGDGSIRGYEIGELGSGPQTVLGTVELRLPAPPSNGTAPPVAFAIFADAGVRTTARNGEQETGTPCVSGASCGYGVHYGPIRVDIALNARGERKVHIGLSVDE